MSRIKYVFLFGDVLQKKLMALSLECEIIRCNRVENAAGWPLLFLICIHYNEVSKLKPTPFERKLLS